ncbi:hypothetical protein Hanom_Chr00s000517g01647351 [Helianthus anomalus]
MKSKLSILTPISRLHTNRTTHSPQFHNQVLTNTPSPLPVRCRTDNTLAGGGCSNRRHSPVNTPPPFSIDKTEHHHHRPVVVRRLRAEERDEIERDRERERVTEMSGAAAHGGGSGGSGIFMSDESPDVDTAVVVEVDDDDVQLEMFNSRCTRFRFQGRVSVKHAFTRSRFSCGSGDCFCVRFTRVRTGAVRV